MKSIYNFFVNRRRRRQDATSIDTWNEARLLGEAKENVREYEQAASHYKEALAMARQIGSKSAEAVTLLHIADLYQYSINNYPQAVDYYTKGLEIVQETGEKVFEGFLCYGIVDALRHLGQHDKAMKYAEEGLNIALSLDDLSMAAVSYQRLARLYDSQYDHENSLKYFKKSIDMMEKLNDKNGLIECFQNLSLVYRQLGKYHDAIYYVEKALTISQETGNRETEVKCITTMGTLFFNLNDFQQGLDFFQQGLAVAREINDRRLQAVCYMDIGRCLIELNDQQKAISMTLKAMEIFHDIDDEHTQGVCNFHIGIYMGEQGRYQEALEYFDKSLNIAKMMNNKDLEAHSYHNIAIYLRHPRDFPRKIDLLKKCLQIACSIENKKLESEACYNLGRVYHILCREDNDQQNLNKSEEYLNKALDCYDYLFKHLQCRDQFKILCLETFLQTYRMLTTVLIEKNQIQDALLVADRKRARALGDRLTFKYGMAHEERLSSRILTYPDCQEIVSDGFFTVMHFSLLRQSLAVWVLSKDSMEFKHLEKEGYDFITETFLHDQEREDDGLNRSFAATVAKAYDKMGIKASRTCESRSLDNCLVFSSEQTRNGGSESLTRDDTIDENSGEELDPLEVLYNCLLSPVIEHVQHDEIVIIPDREMYTVPFAALRDPDTGLYLSDTKRIRLSPSLSILKVLQECPVDHHRGKGSLIIGDPSVGEVLLRGKKTTLERLPSAGREVSFLAYKLRTTALEGEEANKAAVLTKLREGAALIHIAAHGSSDNGEIALAPNPSPDRQGIPEEEDYLLTMKEVEEIGIKAQLVVLSCCHSGRGEIKAEGMVGLSRAFLVAGARAVVASLWAIDDAVTLSFMLSFYDNLCEGKSASVSLNKAMKEIRREGYTDPEYWAPFFLLGDDVTIDLRK